MKKKHRDGCARTCLAVVAVMLCSTAHAVAVTMDFELVSGTQSMSVYSNNGYSLSPAYPGVPIALPESRKFSVSLNLSEVTLVGADRSWRKGGPNDSTWDKSQFYFGPNVLTIDGPLPGDYSLESVGLIPNPGGSYSNSPGFVSVCSSSSTYSLSCPYTAISTPPVSSPPYQPTVPYATTSSSFSFSTGNSGYRPSSVATYSLGQSLNGYWSMNLSGYHAGLAVPVDKPFNDSYVIEYLSAFTPSEISLSFIHGLSTTDYVYGATGPYSYNYTTTSVYTTYQAALRSIRYEDVPEPGVLALMFAGLTGIKMQTRRRRSLP